MGNTEQGMAMMVKGSTKTDTGRYGWKPGHAKAKKGYLRARKRETWRKHKTYLIFVGLWKHAKCGPKQAREFFPANPNLADILREMDFDFQNWFGKEKLDRAFFIITNVEKGG